MGIDLPIVYEAKIKCPKCLKIIEKRVSIENLEQEDYTERGMGEETQYSFSLEIKCPHCKSCLDFEGDIWEYPPGVINCIELA